MGTRRPLHHLGCSSLAFPALIPAGTGLTQAPTATRAGTTPPGAEHPSCSAQQLHRTPGASPQHKTANCFAGAFPQLQLAHSCISFYSSASFFFLFCRCLKKRRLFLITVLRSINERQQCANERDCATWTQCACTALERFLEASFFIPRLPRGDLEMGKD